jgi:hypothetical protein
LALAACVILAITLPMMFSEAPKPADNQLAAIDPPTPKAILAMNIEPAGKEVLAELPQDMAKPIAELNGINAFFEAQFDLFMGE